MAIQRSTIKTGPAVVKYKGATIHFAGGLTITEETQTGDVNADTFGKVDERVTGQQVTVTGTPCGAWKDLEVLFPWINVPIGTRIHGDTDAALVVHAINGDKWTYHNAAVQQMPNLRLSATETLFDSVTFVARVKDNTELSAANSIYTKTTEAFSDDTFDSAEILMQKYSLAWGADPWDDFDTTEGVNISWNLGLSAINLDGYGVIDEMITNFGAEATFTPLGITQSAIDAKLAQQGSANAKIGASLNARGSDLIITGEDVYIKLAGAAAKSTTANFGTEALRNGEITAVATRVFVEGVAAPLAVVDTEDPDAEV